MIYVTAVQKRIGAPLSVILPSTRCRGCLLYSRARMPADPPCFIGQGERPRWLPMSEHLDGTHWDSEKSGGMVTARHNALGAIVVLILKKLGYWAKQHEVMLGKRRDKHGKEYAVKLDALAKNGMAGSGRPIGIDFTVGAALQHNTLRLAATTDLAVCQKLTKAKRKLKEEMCERLNYRLLVVAADSLGALNEETRDLLLAAYKERRGTAKSDAEKWALAYELQHFLERINACIQRGNVAVLLEMAEPLATGHIGRAKLPEGFDEPADGMQMYG